jgi:hypothetical protein
MLLLPFAWPPPVALRLAAVRLFPPPAMLRPRHPVLVLQWAPGAETRPSSRSLGELALTPSCPPLSPLPAAGDGPAAE